MSNSQLPPSSQIPKDDSFLGIGWAFPPRFSKLGPQQGQVEMISAEADIVQSLQIILSTQPGERLMQPDFGCELSQFLFEEIRQGVITGIRGVISDALLYHEPRINVNRIDMDTSQANNGLLLINIDYTVRQTNTRSNLVYPFYLKEATNV
ncbi:GPW/gp25 family protein [Acaryochloris sp. IP29b_bin.148]|uniref:GPW/gp25 family protein n=1 Tax=Acaryochloris sp. IP29b_bin.148 TaxID=2969218 RepID=UPI00261944C5|nr:GPW/gp25 family protein [Acaryochloris sp. IP29b_bin.148]